MRNEMNQSKKIPKRIEAKRKNTEKYRLRPKKGGGGGCGVGWVKFTEFYKFDNLRAEIGLDGYQKNYNFVLISKM